MLPRPQYIQDFIDGLEDGLNQPAVPPAPIPTKALQVIKWAQICSNPQQKEADCLTCPYRRQRICSDALMADAAAVLMDMTLVVSAHA